MSIDVKRDELIEISQNLESASPQQILAWSVDRYAPRLTMATAFGPEGCCLIHMIAELDAAVHLFNLDTGYQFDETLRLRERMLERYGVEIEMVRPETTVAEYEAGHPLPLYKTEPDQCCYDRKIVPLKRQLEGFDAWISAIRRDQSPFRRNAGIVEEDRKFALVKINPLANWTKQQVWKFITDHSIPYNPMHDQGYPSIGCWPCTRQVKQGEDERAGRWSGSEKTECGLHLGGD